MSDQETTLKEAVLHQESYSICGNRIVLCKIKAGDDQTQKTAELSRLCWSNQRRITDGVGSLSSGQGSIRFCFVNPDGSLEAVCGNALLASGPFLGYSAPAVLTIAPFNNITINIHVENDGYTLVAPVFVGEKLISVKGLPESRIHNAGSPHLVARVRDAQQINLAEIGLEVSTLLNVNLTVFSLYMGRITARTYERGVNAETYACGTGAMAAVTEAYLQSLLPDRVIYPGGTYKVKASINSCRATVALHLNKDSIRQLDECSSDT